MQINGIVNKRLICKLAEAVQGSNPEKRKMNLKSGINRNYIKNVINKTAALILSLFFIIGMMTGCDTDISGTGNARETQNESSASSINDGSGVGSIGRPKTEFPAEPMDTAEVHFIDVGQGDSTLIIANDEAMLIDCGDNDKGMSVRRYLEKQGIEELEYVIGTHPDADHIGGMDVVLYNFYCDKVIMPDCEAETETYDDVIKTMQNKSYRITYPKVGDTYTLGSGSFTIIAPNRDDYIDRNDYSVGIIFDYGGTSFAFTGDAEDAEADIVENGIDLSADVFKAGHHGSRTSSGKALLDAINPRYTVISCGAGNKYEHPHNEALERFAERSIEVYRTDTQGTVIAYTDGINITWECEKSVADMQNTVTKVQDGNTAQSSGNTDQIQNPVQVSSSYILNTNTKKYHLPYCGSVKQISVKNKEESSLTAAELEAQGYEPCRNCLK